MSLRYATAAAVLLVAACNSETTAPDAAFARVPKSAHGAHQQWQLGYLSYWWTNVYGPEETNRDFSACQSGPVINQQLTLTFKRKGNTFEGDASPVTLQCFTQDPFGGNYIRDTTIAGGPITGYFHGDSLVIEHADWRVEGVVSPPDGESHGFFSPPAEGAFLIGNFCVPASDPCPASTAEAGGRIGIKRVD